jgi:hypothetical protein
LGADAALISGFHTVRIIMVMARGADVRCSIGSWTASAWLDG